MAPNNQQQSSQRYVPSRSQQQQPQQQPEQNEFEDEFSRFERSQPPLPVSPRNFQNNQNNSYRQVKKKTFLVQPLVYLFLVILFAIL